MKIYFYCDVLGKILIETKVVTKCCFSLDQELIKKLNNELLLIFYAKVYISFYPFYNFCRFIYGPYFVYYKI